MDRIVTLLVKSNRDFFDYYTLFAPLSKSHPSKNDQGRIYRQKKHEKSQGVSDADHMILVVTKFKGGGAYRTRNRGSKGKGVIN